jgi:alanyl-tRNA synthetase
MSITSKELREKYQSFFESKGHARIPSASLIPDNDPTVLFTTAGMHPLVPYLMGEEHPEGKRLTNCQKCIRTGDIDEVGDAWHLSFFEMLGNWSLGDYFKKEAIEFSFEFLTKELGLKKEKISVSVFEGDNDAPREDVADKVWESLGIEKKRIHFLPKKENWWGPAGQTGPCGPDTEMFYRVNGEEEKDTNDFTSRSDDFPEIWNDVFMQYNKDKNGKYIELSKKNVDTGFGLERVVAVLNGYTNAYECDTLKPIFESVKELAGKEKLSENELKSVRIITDHLRASTMILGDDKAVAPSNVDQGYVLRKFIRRSIRHAKLIGIKGPFCSKVAEVVINTMGDTYDELNKNKKFIIDELNKEEEKFVIALEKGTAVLEKKLFYLEKAGQKELNAKGAFDLYQSFGFPLEMTIEMCSEKGFSVDKKGFEKLLSEHQEKSRKGAEKKFKGGLADNSEEVTKLHTATHLLNQALREVVSKDIVQKGSNITSERLRFDFNSDERLTDEQLTEVENWVNKAISDKVDVEMKIVSIDEAKKMGAQMEFGHKYGDKVKVYTIKGKDGTIYSIELCGGPHVKNTKELGHFKIKKQESVAAGVKRIKAIVE